jgi:hypothetical protein
MKKKKATHFAFKKNPKSKNDEHGGVVVGSVIKKSSKPDLVFSVGFSFISPGYPYEQHKDAAIKESYKKASELERETIHIIGGASTGKLLDHVRLAFDTAFNSDLKPEFAKTMQLCPGKGFTISKIS